MIDDVDDYVEGEMSVYNKKSNISSPEFNTLDEPIADTIVILKKIQFECNLYNTNIFSS